jgi:GTP pyrophosphokinase
MELTDRFLQAFSYAFELHRGQKRKGTQIPYMGHLLEVAGIVIDYGGNEDEAIAALLHDAVEDQGGPETRAEMCLRFGENVAKIVDDCSDTDEEPKPPWKQRKKAYLSHLPDASRSAVLVSAADKLHNIRSIIKDYRAEGESVWDRFNAQKEEILWYHRELVKAYKKMSNNSLIDELERALDELEKLTGHN